MISKFSSLIRVAAIILVVTLMASLVTAAYAGDGCRIKGTWIGAKCSDGDWQDDINTGDASDCNGIHSNLVVNIVPVAPFGNVLNILASHEGNYPGFPAFQGTAYKTGYKMWSYEVWALDDGEYDCWRSSGTLTLNQDCCIVLDDHLDAGDNFPACTDGPDFDFTGLFCRPND